LEIERSIFFYILDCALYATNLEIVDDDYDDMDTIDKVRYILEGGFFMASSATVSPGRDAKSVPERDT
jgi:hypothetical protein